MPAPEPPLHLFEKCAVFVRVVTPQGVVFDAIGSCDSVLLNVDHYPNVPQLPRRDPKMELRFEPKLQIKRHRAARADSPVDWDTGDLFSELPLTPQKDLPAPVIRLLKPIGDRRSP